MNKNTIFFIVQSVDSTLTLLIISDSCATELRLNKTCKNTYFVSQFFVLTLGFGLKARQIVQMNIYR